MNYDVIIIGGGAAGFFTAINTAEENPDSKILILERGKEVLTKVKISGGGRCNVTHAEFIPNELVKNYPRGEKELKGPFHRFMTGDTMEWFDKRGVSLKIEEDNRIFPSTDSSQTIIDCFLKEAERLAIEIKKSEVVQSFEKKESFWEIQTNKEIYHTIHLVIATGSNPKIWKQIQKVGHNITSAVPSLFTFNCKDSRITDLPGLSTEVSVEVLGPGLRSEGPLLITHWGLSGPAILKLSAWGALELNQRNYDFDLKVNWLQYINTTDCFSSLKTFKDTLGKQLITKYSQFGLPKRLWQNLVTASGIPETTKWGDLNKYQLKTLSEQLTQSIFKIKGKSTFKEEFVTAGGVSLKEIDFRTFESKIHQDLYFAGEVLNIDAITGGFNFQNAWTGGFMIAQAITRKVKDSGGET